MQEEDCVLLGRLVEAREAYRQKLESLDFIKDRIDQINSVFEQLCEKKNFAIHDRERLELFVREAISA